MSNAFAESRDRVPHQARLSWRELRWCLRGLAKRDLLPNLGGSTPHLAYHSRLIVSKYVSQAQITGETSVPVSLADRQTSTTPP